MKETWDVTYLQGVSRPELGQAELLEVLVVGDLLLFLFVLDGGLVVV